MSKKTIQQQVQAGPVCAMACLCLLIALVLGACAPIAPASFQAAEPGQAAAVEGQHGVSSVETPAPVSEPLVFTDSFSHTVRLTGPAQRIISLAPSNTEILFAIGAGPQTVGRDQFSDFPEQAKQVQDIGGGFGDLNVEGLVVLKPDLVLAAELTPLEQVAALEQAGLSVFVLKNPKNFEGMYDNLVLAGRLTGHEAEARTLVKQLIERVAALEAKITGLQAFPLVFYEIDSTDPNAPWTVGPGTFVDMLITKAGGRNAGSALKSDWGQMSIEELLVKNPDLILLGDAYFGNVKPEDVKARESWKNLAAVRNDQVYAFDDNLVSRPGPRLVDGLEALARQFHPELFK